MHSIEELLAQPAFTRSDRLSAPILNSAMHYAAGADMQATEAELIAGYRGLLESSDCDADRRRLHQLLKALQFVAAAGSPAAAPFLKLAVESVERLCKVSVTDDKRRLKMRQSRTARSVQRTRFYSSAFQPGMRT